MALTVAGRNLKPESAEDDAVGLEARLMCYEYESGQFIGF